MKKVIIIIFLITTKSMFSYNYDFVTDVDLQNEFIYDNTVYENYKINFGLRKYNLGSYYQDYIVNGVINAPNFSINTDFKNFYYGFKFWEYIKLNKDKKLISGYNIKLINIEDNSYNTYYEPINIKLYHLLYLYESLNIVFYNIIGPEFGFEIEDFHNNTIDKYVTGGVLGINVESHLQTNNFSFSAVANIKNTGNYFTGDYFNQANINIKISWFKFAKVWRFIDIKTDEMFESKLSISYKKHYFRDFDGDYDKLSANVSFKIN
jgi:hypothetical protein